jgi:hypothetical protein
MSPYEKGDCLVWFVCHVEISQIIAPLATLLIALKSPQSSSIVKVLFTLGPAAQATLVTHEMLYNIYTVTFKVHSHLVLGTLVLSAHPNTMLVI